MKRFVLFILSILVLSGANLLYAQPDGLYEKSIKEKKYVPYPHLREADVMWSKRILRVIDLREKMNHHLYYPTVAMGDRKSLMAVIQEAINSGEATALYAFNVNDYEMTTPVTTQDVADKLGEGIDTTVAIDPVTGEEVVTVSEREARLDEIKQYYIQEEWYFNKKHSAMEVRILGICPVRLYQQEGTGIPLRQPTFWVYFPELRSTLARYEVFNNNNDANRISFDDLFLQRRFGSFILSESNVYDNRAVTSYETGRMALLEAERIKEWLLNQEHDLWEY